MVENIPQTAAQSVSEFSDNVPQLIPWQASCTLHVAALAEGRNARGRKHKQHLEKWILCLCVNNSWSGAGLHEIYIF